MPAATVLVKDINPGRGSSSPDGLTDVNGTLFFSAEDPTNGRELWKSDGTAAGTEEVRDGNAGSDGAREGHQSRQRRLLPGWADGRERDALLRRRGSDERA